MTVDDPYTIELSPDIEQVFLDSKEPRTKVAVLAAHLRHALELLALNGPLANGAKKLNDLDMYQIRVDQYRLFFGLVPGTRTIAATMLVPKTTGRLPMKTYKHYEKRVRAHVDSLTPSTPQAPNRRPRR